MVPNDGAAPSVRYVAGVRKRGGRDVARFADRNRFASWSGTAFLEASSGEQMRHRLSRAGTAG